MPRTARGEIRRADLRITHAVSWWWGCLALFSLLAAPWIRRVELVDEREPPLGPVDLVLGPLDQRQPVRRARKNGCLRGCRRGIRFTGVGHLTAVLRCAVICSVTGPSLARWISA